MMNPKRLYLSTIGCQMNVYDSEQIAAGLRTVGYEQTFAPEAADLIIVNTCSVRAKAEQKAFSFLGRLAPLKRKKPGLIVGVGGCVAQQEGERILSRMPHVDLVFGTGAIRRLPRLVTKIESRRCRIVDVSTAVEASQGDYYSEGHREAGATRFVTIMRGCDNYCAYCVVPYVRGREHSRLPQSIVEEIGGLVASGTREVTLLGQNVNSYGKKEGWCSFAELLAMVDALDGLARIRFTTSHPKDLDPELIEAFARLPKLCPHIHLPVQSGSDAILKRMNRKYTREVYLDKVRKLRDTCPEIAVTSDIIVGFPGESEADFEQTLELVRTVAFDGLFAFMYSDRAPAPAARYDGKISEAEKSGRLQSLLSLQAGFTREKNQVLVGSRQEVLVEGRGRRRFDGRSDGVSGIQWTGRTRTNKIVHFHQPEGLGGVDAVSVGRLVDVHIERALSHSLWGAPVLRHAAGRASERRIDP